MMVPGLYAIETLVQCNEGESSPCGRRCWAVRRGAMALGLAVARFLSQPEWLRE
jgi:hypothetical protein